MSCIPYGISTKTLGGDFIQEGADNIDLNTETIDRKNTMHSMARAIFQVVQDHTPTSEIISTKIKRGQDRSLSMTEETTSLMTCLPYRKPKERHGSPRYPDPITLIGTISDQAKDETDKAWVLLRMLSRWTIELPVFTNKV